MKTTEDIGCCQTHVVWFIGTARIACGAESMKRHGVRPSVPAWTPAGGDIDRLLHGAQQRGVRRANAGSATLSAYVVAEHST